MAYSVIISRRLLASAVGEGAARTAGGREIRVARECDGEPAFVAFFRAADRLATGETFAEDAQQQEVDRILDCLVSDG